MFAARDLRDERISVASRGCPRLVSTYLDGERTSVHRGRADRVIRIFANAL